MSKQVMTEIKVTYLGGPKDGKRATVRIPLEDEATGWIRGAGIVYRIHRAGGITFLVHPDAQGLFR